MENFQLYRTNILLGGQMKWDLILDNSTNGLMVTDLHLTPISSNIPYTYQSDEQLMNNSHEDNVKSYYKYMAGSFYADGMNPEFNHNYPIIVSPNTHMYTYNDVCDMGCRRMKHYDLYNKQFEFFCPIWLEHMSDDIVFTFSVSDYTSGNNVSQRTLTIKRNDLTDKFSKYFNEYMSNCGIHDGTDDVMMINIENGLAYISGLNAKTGIHTVKNINNVTNVITSRERPLMEFDNILISNFSNNNIVAKQLINLNFCFNLSDLVSSSIANIMSGKNTTVSVSVSMGDKTFEIKDFDTEYDYIPKQIIHSDNSLDDNINVLNYLIDYKCIDLIDKNKYSQQVCHWSLCDCNDYIFNLYNGFSGYSISNGNIIQSKHQYGRTPSFDTQLYNEFTNNVGWLNLFKLDAWADFYKFINNIRKNKSDMSVFDDKIFVNDVKYAKLPDTPIYFCGLYVNKNLLTKITNNGYITFNIDNNISVILIDDYGNDIVIFVSSEINNFTHKNMYDKLIKSNDVRLKGFINTFTSFVTPSVITLSSSIIADRVSGPSSKTDEVIYYKDNGHSEYVVRYDGKIKPHFTNSRTMYYKDYISDERKFGLSKLQNSTYGQYLITGYEPLYKSIGYYSILSTDIDYINIPKVKVSEFDGEIDLIQTPEYKWFNVNKLLVTKPCHNFIVNKTIGESLEDKIDLFIKDYYGVENSTYIRSLYNLTYDWDYISLNNINQYKYNVTLKLK